MASHSTFRYAKCTQSKEFYSELRCSSPATSSLFLAASAFHVAVPYGERGDVCLLPQDVSEFKRNPTPFLVQAHGDALHDLSFNPFNHHQLATGGADGTVKLFSLPETGLTEHLANPVQSVGGLGSVHNIRFNESAAGVLAVGTKTGISVLDMEQGAVLHSAPVSGFGKDMVSLSWSLDGSRLAAVGKDGQLRLFDPRSPPEDLLAAGQDAGTKAQRVLFVGESGNLLVLGLNRTRKPEAALLDPRNLSTPLKLQGLGFSTGTVLPVYDRDTQLLFMTLKGSSLLNVYDCSQPAAKVFTAVDSVATTGGGFQGLCTSPKGCLNLEDSEVQRLFKLTQNSVVPLPVNVPRKKRGFHEELYPRTASLEAALTLQQWNSGDNRDPKLVEITVAQEQATPQAKVEAERKRAEAKARRLEEKKQQQQQQEEAKRTYVPTSTRTHLDVAFRKSPFLHCKGAQPPQKHSFYYDIAPDQTKSLSLSRNIVANGRFWAIPWKTSGPGAVHVQPLDKKGRVGIPSFVRGHKSQVTTLHLSTLQPELLATADGSGHAMVWSLPAGGLTEDMKTPLIDVRCSGKVTNIKFHPWMENAMYTSSVGFSGASVRLWDIQTAQEVHHMQCHQQPLYDLVCGPDGVLVGTTSKDTHTRILDPRADTVAQDFETLQGARDTRLIMAEDGRYITVGFGKGSKRSISLWDPKNVAKPLSTQHLDNTNATMIPHYDDDTGLLYVGYNGTRSIGLFQVSSQLEFLNVTTISHDLMGLAFLPKAACNVKEVQVAQALSLNLDRVVPITYTIPRKRKEFFQDDIFPDTRAVETLFTLDQYKQGATAEAKYVSLRPAGMELLSKAPAEKLTDRQLKYKQHLAEEAKEAPRGALGTADDVKEHFANVAKMGMGRKNQWDADVEDDGAVDDDEWSD